MFSVTPTVKVISAGSAGSPDDDEGVGQPPGDERSSGVSEERKEPTLPAPAHVEPPGRKKQQDLLITTSMKK